MEPEVEEKATMKKVMFIVARLVPTPEAYEGKTNQDIERDILEEQPVIPYVAEIERTRVFNSLAGEEEADESKAHVAEAFKPVHQALAKACQSLAEHGILAWTSFNAGEGFFIVTLEKAKRE